MSAKDTRCLAVFLRDTADLLTRCRLIRSDYDALPFFDGDLDTPGTIRLIRRYGKHVNDALATLVAMRYRGAA